MKLPTGVKDCCRMWSNYRTHIRIQEQNRIKILEVLEKKVAVILV